RAMVADGPARQLDAVADDVVLIRLERQRVLRLERVQAALRHRKRIVAELDFPGLLVTLVHREIDHPAESKGVLFDESELLAETCPRLAGQTVRGCALVAYEEHRVAIRGARRAAKRRQPCLVQEFRDRSAGGAIGEDDVAEPGRALVARPLVQLVEEAARLRGG